MPSNQDYEDGSMPEKFDTTHWSVVQAAGRNSSNWFAPRIGGVVAAIIGSPLRYVRRQGNSPEDAQDLTQEFFSRSSGKGVFQAGGSGAGPVSHLPAYLSQTFPGE